MKIHPPQPYEVVAEGSPKGGFCSARYLAMWRVRLGEFMEEVGVPEGMEVEEGEEHVRCAYEEREDTLRSMLSTIEQAEAVLRSNKRPVMSRVTPEYLENLRSRATFTPPTPSELLPLLRSHPTPSTPPESACSKCHREFSATDMITPLPCKHVYHSSCIEDWMANSTFCYYCGESVTEEGLATVA